MKWEYRVIPFSIQDSADTLQRYMNDLGALKWELVAVLRDRHAGLLFFKQETEV